MFWHKLQQVLRGLTGKKEPFTPPHSSTTTGIIFPTPPSLLRPSPHELAGILDRAISDPWTEYVNSFHHTSTTDASPVASSGSLGIVGTSDNNCSDNDPRKADENTTVSSNVFQRDDDENGSQQEVDCVGCQRFSDSPMTKGNVEEFLQTVNPLQGLQLESHARINANVVDMDLFDGSQDTSIFQSLAAAVATPTAHVQTLDCKPPRVIIFETEHTEETFLSLSAVLAPLRTSAQFVIDGPASVPSDGPGPNTATQTSPVSSYTSTQDRTSASSTKRTRSPEFSDEQSSILQSAATIITGCFGTKRDQSQTEALHGNTAIAEDVLQSIVKEDEAFPRIIGADTALVQHNAESHQLEVDASTKHVPLPTLPADNAPIFAERHQALASRLADIANYAGGKFMDPGATDCGPSVQEQLEQEKALNRFNVAAFEGDGLLDDSDWAPSGFHCDPNELGTSEEEVRHMNGHIGHGWAFFMTSIHPRFTAEAWAQEDILKTMGVSGCVARRRIHAYLDPARGAGFPWAHADVLRQLEGEFLWQTALYAHAMNDLRTTDYDPLPVDELLAAGGEEHEWADSEGEQEEGYTEYVVWRAKLAERPRRKGQRHLRTNGSKETMEVSDNEVV